jgi:hypothetical protein
MSAQLPQLPGPAPARWPSAPTIGICGSYRVTAIAMATGHAAGVCGALAARHRSAPREVDVREVQRELLRQGASLRPEICARLGVGVDADAAAPGDVRARSAEP